jgi:hypothetical protein
MFGRNTDPAAVPLQRLSAPQVPSSSPTQRQQEGSLTGLRWLGTLCGSSTPPDLHAVIASSGCELTALPLPWSRHARLVADSTIAAVGSSVVERCVRAADELLG